MSLSHAYLSGTLSASRTLSAANTVSKSELDQKMQIIINSVGKNPGKYAYLSALTQKLRELWPTAAWVKGLARYLHRNYPGMLEAARNGLVKINQFTAVLIQCCDGLLFIIKED